MNWIEINPDRLPEPVKQAYRQQGHQIVKAEVKPVGRRPTYRVTSSTGRRCEWRPSTRALMGWVPSMLK